MQLGTCALNSHHAWRAQPVARVPPQALCSRCLVLGPPQHWRPKHRTTAEAVPGRHSTGPATPRPLAPSAASAAVSSTEGFPEPGTGIIQAAINQYHRFMGLAGKFMPMVGLFFLLAFVNTILDSLKDTLVITAVGGGAQVIPYLTVYAVLPSSLAFLLAYSLASQHMSRPALFNAIVTAFMGFFMLFAFVLYPNHQTLHPHAMADQLSKVIPQGLEGLVGMIRNWTFTAFFCMSELWGDVCLGLLFWGLANDTTKLADAPTLYPLFGLGANVAQALGGSVLKIFSGVKGHGVGDFGSEIQALMLVVVGFTLAALAMHAYIDRKHEAARHSKIAKAAARARAAAARAEAAAAAAKAAAVAAAQVQAKLELEGGAGGLEARRASHSEASSSSGAGGVGTGKGKKAGKEKPPVGEIFRVLAASVPIRCLAIMSLAQGLCTSLMEFAWKSHIGLLFPSPTQFTSFLGDVSMWQGVVTGFLMVLSPAMFDRLGWAGVAGCTPRVLLFGGAAFFASCLVYQWAFATHAAASLQSAAVTLATGAASAAHGVTAGSGGIVLQALVYGGALLYVFSKSAKFSLFKPAEEMVYISLDEEGRTKGKAAIDVVGSQAGKSSGSIMQQVLLLMSGGAIAGIIPILAVFYFAMAQGWLRSVSVLSEHADYGHPDSVHESVQVLQAATLGSMDEDEDTSGGTAHGNGNGNGSGNGPFKPSPPPGNLVIHINGNGNGHGVEAGVMASGQHGLDGIGGAGDVAGVEAGGYGAGPGDERVVLGAAARGGGAMRAMSQSRDVMTPAVMAAASAAGPSAVVGVREPLTPSVTTGSGRQVWWEGAGAAEPHHPQQQQVPLPSVLHSTASQQGERVQMSSTGRPERSPSPEHTRLA